MENKEREAFESWHDGLFDVSASTAVKNECGYPQSTQVQTRWQAWQARPAHDGASALSALWRKRP